MARMRSLAGEQLRRHHKLWSSRCSLRHIAALRHGSCLCLLHTFSHGSQTNSMPKISIATCPLQLHRSCLHQALYWGHLTIAARLLEAGASLHVPDHQVGRSARRGNHWRRGAME